jgi:endoglycosylceramidase
MDKDARRHRSSLGMTTLLVLATGCGSSSSSPSAAKTATPPGTVTCTLAAPMVPDWRLTTSGTDFHDALGRVVFLRGIDGGGRSKFAPYVPFDYPAGGFADALGQYMDRAASWGIDVMRVPFTWAALEPTQGTYDMGWTSLYGQILQAAWARGIYTVLDFHQDVYSEVFCGDGFPAWTVANPPAASHDCPNWDLEYFNDPPMEQAFDAFWAQGSPIQPEYLAAWDQMVGLYKDTPGVLGFEPLNEPGWGTADEGTFAATTLTDFYTMMVGHLRAAAPSSLVFIDLPGLDGATISTKLQRPQGDGIVFTPHYYAPTTNPQQILSGMQTWASVGQSWNVPTYVDEFGTSHDDSTSPATMTATFAALDAYGLSGSEWEYSVSVDSWNEETDSIVAADGGEYPVAQAVIRPYARAVAGSAITQSFDPAARTYTLSFTAAPGITEVSVPARLYPAGLAVQATGACVDTTSVPGKVLLQSNADAGATVTFTVGPKGGADGG